MSGEKLVRDPMLVEIGARIKQIRSAGGMTQKDLGERAGVSPAYIYIVETGGQNITITVFRRLAEALGVPMASLLAIGDADVAPSEQSLAYLSTRLDALTDHLKARVAIDKQTLQEITDLSSAHKKFIQSVMGAGSRNQGKNDDRGTG